MVTVLLLLLQATQRDNSYQFATTDVTVSVLVKSLHRPRFQRPVYEGVVTAMGVIATDAAAEGKPLTILATDDDYAAVKTPESGRRWIEAWLIPPSGFLNGGNVEDLTKKLNS